MCHTHAHTYTHTHTHTPTPIICLEKKRFEGLRKWSVLFALDQPSMGIAPNAISVFKPGSHWYLPTKHLSPGFDHAPTLLIRPPKYYSTHTSTYNYVNYVLAPSTIQSEPIIHGTTPTFQLPVPKAIFLQITHEMLLHIIALIHVVSIHLRYILRTAHSPFTAYGTFISGQQWKLL